MDTAALAASMLSMQAASTRQTAGTMVLAKQMQQQRDTVMTLLDGAAPPAPPGMGLMVDKRA